MYYVTFTYTLYSRLLLTAHQWVIRYNAYIRNYSNMCLFVVTLKLTFFNPTCYKWYLGNNDFKIDLV